MPKETRQQFSKGVNQRVSIERGDPERLNKLQNARLQERGNTLEISRIKGFERIPDSTITYDKVYDAGFFDNEFVVLWYNTNVGEVHITFTDVDDGSETDLSFSDTEADYGELRILENNIYLTPYNKQLNKVGGTWRLTAFTSTTPTFNITEGRAEFAEGSVTVDSTAGLNDQGYINIDGASDVSFSIVAGDTVEDVAESLTTAFNGSFYATDYTATRSGAIVTIKANSRGESFNGTINVTTDLSGATFTTENLTGGENGTLDANTYYWYKLRFVYYDGHKTITSYPQFIQTSSSSLSANISDIIIPDDLDGNLVDIEVFRKKEGGDWFLIERVTPDQSPYSYIDDGKGILSPLDERNYVWAKNPKTHDIVRDRLVRANLEYTEKVLGWDEGDVVFTKNSSLSTLDDTRLPKNVFMEVFGQARYKDGTLSPHKKIGDLQIDDEEVTFATDPQTQPSNVDNLNEVAYYGQFKPKSPVTIPFNTLEIYNANVPSLATKFKPEAEQDKPLNPRVFLGYKYLWVREDVSATERIYSVFDEDWDYDGTNYVGTDDDTSVTDDVWQLRTESYSSQWGDSPPDTITETLITGQQLTYKYKYRLDGADNTFVYELAMVEPLKRAVSEGKINLKLTGTNVSKPLSSQDSNNDFIENEVRIIGIEDTSETRQQAHLTSDAGGDLVVNTGKNHVYLILDNDSVYGNYDNELLNNENILDDYDSGVFTPDLTHVFEFELINVQEKDFGAGTTEANYSEDANITEGTVDYGLTEYSPISQPLEELLYLGTQNEFNQDNLFTYITGYFDGYINDKADLFEFQTLSESSIFSNLILEEDIEQFQENYPNQLVWGGPFILESNASGVRDFEFTNFKNISQDYGEIVKISYINNVLLVFCERGVNRIIVGEVLTQQTGGEVFVDSSSLLNNDVWILKNIPNIQAKSVKQYEDMLFFSDGRDVWKYQNGLENISNGAVDLGDVATSVHVASIDPKNKEYHIATPNGTWAYSIELGEWMGAHTYEDTVSAPYRDRMFSIVGNEPVEHNIGNDFNGVVYDTIIESVANILGDASITKLFRKFYIETDGDGTFSYGKNYGTWTDKLLSNYPNKNGIYHIGINGINKNARQIYWKLKTQTEDFLLSLVSFVWDARKRR